MTTFLDGPAAGLSLLLRHAPKLLRVTCNAGVQFDALDAPHDAPQPGETLTAYRLVGTVGTLHIDFARGKGRDRSGWFAIAKYRVCEIQPADLVMRHNDAWQRWAAFAALNADEQLARERAETAAERAAIDAGDE